MVAIKAVAFPVEDINKTSKELKRAKNRFKMVQIKAYRGSEIRRFEIAAEASFAQLKELVTNLFGINAEDTVVINYCDREGDIVGLSSDAELQTALKHLGEEDTWKLQVLVQHKQEQRGQNQTETASWWNWNPFHIHFRTLEPS